MNERIKELADHALQIVADEHTKGDASRLNTDAYHVKELINQKFAELIVNECMAMCNETKADYLKHRKDAYNFQEKNIYAEGEAASDIIKYKIKKHFKA